MSDDGIWPAGHQLVVVLNAGLETEELPQIAVGNEPNQRPGYDHYSTQCDHGCQLKSLWPTTFHNQQRKGRLGKVGRSKVPDEYCRYFRNACHPLKPLCVLSVRLPSASKSENVPWRKTLPSECTYHSISMKLVMRRSLFAAGGLGGVMHFLNAQQTRKVRGILESDILRALANCLLVQTALYPSEPE